MAETSRHLDSELEFSRRLAGWLANSVDVQTVLDEIVGWVAERFRGDEGCIRLSMDDTPAGLTQARGGVTLSRKNLGSGSWPTAVAISVMGCVNLEGKPLVTPNLVDDLRFRSLQPEDTHIRSLMAVPIFSEGQNIGVLAVTRTEPNCKWSESDQELLSLVAELSGPVVQRAIERQRAAEHNADMQDIERAKAVQDRALPVAPIDYGAWQIAGKIQTARRVGGDLFGYWPLEGDRLAVVVADVEGKGFPAALTMMRLHGLLLGLCNGRTNPCAALNQVNQGLYDEGPQQVTLFYAELDAGRGSMRYVRAGHPYPFLTSDGKVTPLHDGTLPLGVLPDAGVEEFEVPFGPHDALFVFSDGVPDAVDPNKSFYDEARLETLWAATTGSASHIVDDILADVNRFIGSEAQADDMTALVIAPRE